MRPLPLRELQAGFWQAIAGDAPPDLLAAIADVGRLGPAARLRIYGDMYHARLREALREDHPKVAELLGDEEFGALVRAYLARSPSSHPSIRYAGAGLAAFIAAERPLDPPFLADLARLEWARVEVFDAPDARPLTMDDLRAVPPEDFPGLRFAPVPACDVVEAKWPIHRLWAGERDVGPAPTVLRVWRQDFAVFHASMDIDEQAAFLRVRRQEPFSAIAEGFARLGAEAAAREVGGLVARWVEDAVIQLVPKSSGR